MTADGTPYSDHDDHDDQNENEGPEGHAGDPLPAESAEDADHDGAPAAQVDVLVAGAAGGPAPVDPAVQVKGRIDIENEVVEKVAAIAATEVTGVADLGGDVERTVETVRERIGIGHRHGDQGVSARIDGGDVSIDVTLVVEYGHVVMDVARDVQTNVAVQANRMLGLRVVEVNVVVDDVRLPEPPAAEAADPVSPADQA
jgi:uncharacterized alkaline shock family protein YloU